MASFLSASEENWFAEQADIWFDTFKRNIVVHKEPIKNIKITNSNQLFGYGQAGQANSQQIEYTPRSQSFDAVIKYGSNQDLDIVGDIKAYVTSQNLVSIIVKPNAKEYINKDKTEKIVFDSKSYNTISNGALKSFFSAIYYEYILQEIT